MQYQCVDSAVDTSIVSQCLATNNNLTSICPTLTSTSQYQKLWCDLTAFSISCPTSTVISILCAAYGIDPLLRCGSYYTGAPTACNSFDAYNKVRTACANKQTCTLSSKPTSVCSSGYALGLIVQVGFITLLDFSFSLLCTYF